jgi:hypothetical protein
MTGMVRGTGESGWTVHRVSTAVLVLLLLALAGCDRSSSSSSSGSGSAGPTEFAGTYQGTLRTTASLGNESVSETFPVTIRIAANGRVEFDVDDRTGCRNVPAVFLEGDRFRYSARYDCPVPNLGSCEIREEAAGQVRGNRLDGTLNGTVRCPVGTATLTGTLDSTRVN